MRIADSLTTGKFLKRDNRFKASVLVEGRPAFAHVPNSGRMQELLVEGAEVALVPAGSPERITDYDLVQVFYKNIWVSTDSRMPNRLIVNGYKEGLIPEFQDYVSYKKEPAFGSGRFDLALEGPPGKCLIECKSVNLVENGVAMFPDAPTTRGARHLRELAGYVQQGGIGYVIFIIQRPDAKIFIPFSERDPDFALACKEAVAAGVNILAINCNTGFGTIELADRIKVKI